MRQPIQTFSFFVASLNLFPFLSNATHSCNLDLQKLISKECDQKRQPDKS